MLKNIATCMDKYGVGNGSEWGHNIVSTKAVQGPSGRVGYPGHVDRLPLDAALVKCQALAEAAYLQGKNASFDVWGSEGAEGFEPYYVAAHETWRCERITAQAIRAAFGGTLYPKASITLETLDALSRGLDDQTEGADDERFEQWRELIRWFRSHPDFVETAYVSIDSDGESLEGGCVYPRLMLGRLADGSLVGLFGVVVYT